MGNHLIQKSGSIDQKSQLRNLNNFDLIRFISVSFVIFAHSYALLGIRDNALKIGNIDFGGFGVSILFILSGYLITQSWERDPSLLQYFWKRFLRIVPGLVCVTLFVLFIIGPLVTILPIWEYFTNDTTYDYLRMVTIFWMMDKLPGVFVYNPFTSATNGSLWILPYELTFYFIVAFLGITGLIYKKKFIIISCIFAFFGYFISNFNPSFLWTIQYFRLYAYFSAGKIFYLYRGVIKYTYKIQIPSLITLFVFANTPFYEYACFILLPYIIFYFALFPNKILNNFGKYGDFSYGMYLYAFPIQQTLIHFFRDLPVILLILLSILLSIFFGFLSWHFIETRALKLKRVKISPKIKENKIFFYIDIILFIFYFYFFMMYSSILLMMNVDTTHYYLLLSFTIIIITVVITFLLKYKSIH